MKVKKVKMKSIVCVIMLASNKQSASSHDARRHANVQIMKHSREWSRSFSRMYGRPRCDGKTRTTVKPLGQTKRSNQTQQCDFNKPRTKQPLIYLTIIAYLHQQNFYMKFCQANSTLQSQEGGAASRVASHSHTSSPYMHRQIDGSDKTENWNYRSSVIGMIIYLENATQGQTQSICAIPIRTQEST